MSIILFDSGKRIKHLEHDIFYIIAAAGIQNWSVQNRQIAATVFCDDSPVIFYFVAVFSEVIQADNKKPVPRVQFFDQTSQCGAIRSRVLDPILMRFDSANPLPFCIGWDYSILYSQLGKKGIFAVLYISAATLSYQFNYDLLYHIQIISSTPKL